MAERRRRFHRLYLRLVDWGLIALAALSFVRPVHPTAFQNYASFKGARQGQLKGSKSKGGREDQGWFLIQSFDLAGEVPVDAGKGGDAGKRTHNPITITKETDAASPQLLQAHSTNEVFDNIVIQTLDDQHKVAKTITLTNAIISDFRKTGGGKTEPAQKVAAIETISFTYEKITEQQ